MGALAWIDAFERTGGRVLCDGAMFAVTLPPEPDVTLIPPNDLTLIAAARVLPSPETLWL